MFVKEGWSSPYSLFQRLYDIELDAGASTAIEDFEAFTNEALKRAEYAFFHLMMSAKYGGVMLPSSDVVSVDGAFLSNVHRVHPFVHGYFDLRTGEVGRTNVTWVKDCIRVMKRTFSRRLLSMAAIAGAASLTITISFLTVLRRHLSGYSDYIGSESHYALIFWLVMIYAALQVMMLMPIICADFMRQRSARRSCRAYAGGHLIIPDQVYEEFVRYYYRRESPDAPAAAAGRPRHPAYSWYEERNFDRGGMTMKDLQKAMPPDEKGNPPSEATIRSWEQQKTPAEM